MKSKIISAERAAELIKDGVTIAWTSSSLLGFAEEVAMAIEKRFLETGSPRDLTVTHSTGCGGNSLWSAPTLSHGSIYSPAAPAHSPSRSPPRLPAAREPANEHQGALIPSSQSDLALSPPLPPSVSRAGF